MQHIIACIDSSAARPAVCDAAAWAANRLAKPLLLLHTLERQQQHGADDLSGSIGLGARSSLLARMADLDEERGRLALQLGKSLLEETAADLALKVNGDVSTLLRHGDIVETLVELEREARLMVVGKTGTDHDGDFAVLGSHIETLIRQVHTSILMTSGRFAVPENFMLAYDGRDTADRSLERIITGGLLTGLPCHLVMVKTGDSAREAKLPAAAARLTEQGYAVTATLLDGPIFESLQRYQQDHGISLLIMGAFGHSKVRQLFLGSNTIRMMENTTVPLIVLR